MPKFTGIVGYDNNLVGVTDDNKIKVKATVSAISQGEIWGWDKYPTGWVILGGTITTDDWIKITIDGYDCQYTIQAGDTWDNIVQGLVDAINNNSNVNGKVDAFNQYKLIFIRAEEAGEKYNNLSLSTSVSGGATITATRSYSEIKKLWKEILIEQDKDDKRYGWLGIYGDVGSRTKADNPIHITVRKSIATSKEVVFIDKNVPSNKVWYITNVAVADDISTEFRLYHGIERDRVEYYSGDGNEDDFTIDYNAISSSDYISITVDGSPLTLDSDYWVYLDPNNEEKSYINFKNPPGSGTNNIVITYQACKLDLGLFVQASSSQPFDFGAPIKLNSSNFIIGTVSNKSANAGIAIMNINGFYEDEV